jgi:hypothetical protein
MFAVGVGDFINKIFFLIVTAQGQLIHLQIIVYITFVITLSSYMMVYNLIVWISAVKYSVDGVMLLSHLFCIIKYYSSFFRAFLFSFFPDSSI